MATCVQRALTILIESLLLADLIDPNSRPIEPNPTLCLEIPSLLPVAEEMEIAMEPKAET